MVSLFSIVLTFLALVLIPAGLFISRRLSVPLSFRNILRFIELTASKNNDEKERNDKRGTMRKKRLPKHVAIILDGNRRWAEKRGLRTYEGHKAGARKLMESAKDFFDMTTSTCHKDRARKLMENTKDCFDMGTKTLSLFAFSTENWARPEDEVNGLMSLFEEYFRSEIHVLKREKIKISVIGNRTRIPQSLLDLIREAEEDTKGYVGKHLILAIDYSGKFDILQACKSLAEKAKSGLIQIEDIDESIMDEELMTKCSEFPNPDLLIRTSGEQRISNFFLWQSAYTELYFTNVLWPDFGETEFLDALTWYQERDRRFGRRV